ncbi:MAG: glycosyltransferase family 2 protein [Bacteroidales bacterium]|nr:glycosyltransferase family 2 protein [Bacteroidales bacterium]
MKDLHEQAVNEGIEFEIVLIDDASLEHFRAKNRHLTNLKNVVLIEEPENLGRSKIRNKLADSSKYSHLLFMDCDSKVSSNRYISQYLKYCDGYDDVVILRWQNFMKKQCPEDPNAEVAWETWQFFVRFFSADREPAIQTVRL